MIELVAIAIAAMRAAYVANAQLSDSELLQAGFAAADAREASEFNQRMKDNLKRSKSGPRRMLEAAIWCLRNSTTDFLAGWTATGRSADGFDAAMRARLNVALTPAP